ncbi:MAG: DUF599 family protein [Candidatus Competibacteraceae bacterium]|nr:DUF599 family protein [Candidatus Competibacteraceae bacterium]
MENSVVTPSDALALGWFLFCWIGYALAADRLRAGRSSLMRATRAYREAWMRGMLEREVRIGDTNLVGHLMHSVSFFASTTIIIIGGLIAMLGAVDQTLAVTDTLSFTVSGSREALELKLLLLLVIFTYAFFKFTWSLRQFNYCCILIGAAPNCFPDQDSLVAYARRAARLNALAGDHFNRGLRAYYFGLAILAWFVHPWLFMAVSAFVVAVLYRREFASDILQALEEHP